MSRSNQSTYITPVGLNLVEPIVSLVAFLDALDSKGTNDVQASSIENGYSSSVILLTACLLEATMNRVRYVDEELRRSGKRVPAKSASHPLEFFRERFLQGRHTILYQQLREVFVLRDVVAHSHIWEASIDDITMRLHKANLMSGYANDPKFKALVDVKRRRTKFLKANVFPTRICCWDALKILKTAVRVLRVVEKEAISRNVYYVNVTGHHVPFKKNFPRFEDVIQGIRWERWKA